MVSRIEHRPPTDATVKQMYATAFQCAHPKCGRPLYRMDDVTGDLTLNSTVAHIHARRENGPRWLASMSEEDNRAEANLVLLCLEHSSEVDRLPDDYPADDMRNWKAAVRAAYNELQRGWPLTDDQVAEVMTASFKIRDFARVTVESQTLAHCVRLAATLIEHSRSCRRKVEQISAEWLARGNWYTAQLRAWDDQGELLRVSPPEGERREYSEAMRTALTDAQDKLEPTLQSLAAELFALRATNPELADWCEWVEREARGLVTECTRAALEQALPAATDPLSGAIEALSAKWRGEASAAPPAAPESPSVPEPSAEEQARSAIAELVARARPWTRVTSRPYDADLYDLLVVALPTAATFPVIPSYLAFELTSVAQLAAAVARNATDDVYANRLEEAASLEPVCVAVSMLTNLQAVAKESGQTAVSARAEELAQGRVAAQSWVGVGAWDDNLLHCRALLGMLARQTSVEEVREMVSGVLSTTTPGHVLVAISSWSEQFARHDLEGPSWPVPKVRDLPDWLPADDLAAAVHSEWPDLTEADLDSDDVGRRLAAQFLALVSTG